MRLSMLVLVVFFGLVMFSTYVWAHDYASAVSVSGSRHGDAAEKTPVNPARLDLQVGHDMENAVLGDFNKDGYLDIAAVSHGGNCLKIFLGKGHRKFELAQVLSKKSVGYHPDHIALFDWDNDGFDDLILAAEGSSAVFYFRNDKGRFVETPKVFEVKNAPKDIAIADLDNDGKQDIVLSPYGPYNISVLWGKDPDKFVFDVSYITRVRNFTGSSVFIDDWNGDGKKDVFFLEPNENRVRVALNQGKRHFRLINVYSWTRKSIYEPPFTPASFALADLNGDGCVDVLTAMEIGKVAVIAYGDCKGNTVSMEEIPAPAWGYRGCGAVAADHGHPAIIALGEKLKMFLGRKGGDDKWILKRYKAGVIPANFQFHDIDNDGNLDVIFTDYSGDVVTIYFGPLF